MPEYLLLFRKWENDGVNPEPVKHYRSEKEAEEAGGSPRQVLDLETWQKYASPCWLDIRRTDVLNARLSSDDKDEKHICPLQLEVIRRAVRLYTNPDDIVYSPFGGIGSEPYIALEQGRRAIAVELKESYFSQMVANCNDILSVGQLSLFGNGGI